MLRHGRRLFVDVRERYGFNHEAAWMDLLQLHTLLGGGREAHCAGCAAEPGDAAVWQPVFAARVVFHAGTKVAAGMGAFWRSVAQSASCEYTGSGPVGTGGWLDCRSNRPGEV